MAGTIRFITREHPDGVVVPIRIGQDLLGALLDAHQSALYLCMAGSCRHCRVTVKSGGHLLSLPGGAEPPGRLPEGDRLACQAKLIADGEVVIEQK
jgi:ferredoxin